MPLAATVFSTVLFPLDQSRAALDTIATVLKLVQEHQSKLLLLSVVDSESSDMADAGDVAQLLEKAQETFAGSSKRSLISFERSLASSHDSPASNYAFVF